MKKMILLLAAVLLAGCKGTVTSETDSHLVQGCDVFEECGDETIQQEITDFKQAYEALNGKESASGKLYRSITIPENHPFRGISGKDAIQAINSGEECYLYVGDAKCPWCRAVIQTAAEKAVEYGIDEILYLPIWDDEGNEILRDKYEVVNGTVARTVEGTVEYFALLNRFDAVLNEYVLQDGDTKIGIGEKRILAPSFFHITNHGKDINMTDALPSTLSDPSGELSDKQEEEIAASFDELFREQS